jgi:hypothetical protein
MISIKDQVFREFGDEGADTLERYFAQIEYTALWCIRMLHDAEKISAVIPESVEDVVVVRQDVHELHQVKTRDESQGPWTTAIVLPILCQQYHRRKAFPGECRFHFVSNQMADTKTRLREDPPAFGPLYRLKLLLEIRHDGQIYSADEQKDLKLFERVLLPRIRANLLGKHQDNIDDETAASLLHNTWIETDCPMMRNPNNLTELENALSDLFPGTPSYTTLQLKEMYGRVLLLIVGKIVTGRSPDTRRITRGDVLNCRTTPRAPGAGFPDLGGIPGRTTLDKKARLGGFDPTEIPVFHRQKKLAQWVTLELETLDLTKELDHLTTAILDLQTACRHKVCREQGVEQKPGPRILEMLRPKLSALATHYFPESRDVDDQFCLGVLWRETDLCPAWWHALDGFAQEAQHEPWTN